MNRHDRRASTATTRKERRVVIMAPAYSGVTLSPYPGVNPGTRRYTVAGRLTQLSVGRRSSVGALSGSERRSSAPKSVSPTL